MDLGQSYTNWALLITVAIPPLCTGYLLSHFCANPASKFSMCSTYVHMPLLSINVMWLLHVDLTFYIISLIQVRHIELLAGLYWILHRGCTGYRGVLLLGSVYMNNCSNVHGCACVGRLVQCRL